MWIILVLGHVMLYGYRLRATIEDDFCWVRSGFQVRNQLTAPVKVNIICWIDQDIKPFHKTKVILLVGMQYILDR
jgi:hypothetical protein